MSKRTLTLLVSFAVLVLLSAVYFAVSKTGEDGSETTTPPPASYVVSAVDIDSLTDISYSVGENTFAFSYDRTEKKWLWTDDDSLPISDSIISEMVSPFKNLTSSICLENVSAEDEALYGISTPTATITLKDKNGEHTLRLGIRNSFNGYSYIATGDGNVYMPIFDFTDLFPEDIMDIINIPKIPAPALSEKITLTLKKGEDIYLYTYYPEGNEIQGTLPDDATDWTLTADEVETYVSSELAESLTTAMKYLAFAECISYSKDLSKFGLDDPATVTLNYTTIIYENDGDGQTTTQEEKITFSFLIGDADEYGYAYAKTEDSPLVYIMASEVFSMLMPIEE